MGRRGRHRDFRDRVLARVEENDPELHAELVELRSRNPQEYRKRIREAVKLWPVDGPQRLISNRMAWTHAQHLTAIEDVLAKDDVYSLRAALKRGNFDGRLEELELAEKAGQNRPFILHIIDEHRRREAREAEPKPLMPPVSEWVQKVGNVARRLALPEDPASRSGGASALPEEGEDG